ncbi:hypothetical protein LIX60_17730 [Streptomyces sp. S07_1.15]|uniref:hypothetical protein n=1 Tax=Streptomyces sp. S07_1.15 TaxID=2873925 RepID=UPI001D15D88D|nr:hypothetical protein [Streptomyces sp. S07_1.15]MCC3653270.1 hypothetical protein [Streptomyces sp. S07_1.15]
MGIESDQLVLDYLSRVGDLAQQRQLSSGDRMRLVSQLRQEIEQQRTKAADSPGAVKRILGRLGSPEDVVREAGGRAPGETGGGSAGRGGDAPERPVHRPVTEAGREDGPGAGRKPGRAGKAGGRGGGRRPGRGAGPAAGDGTGPGGGTGTGAGAGGGGSRAAGTGAAAGGHPDGRSTLGRLGALARRAGLIGGTEVPAPRDGAGYHPAEPPVVPVIPLTGPMPPHLAGEDELRGADGTEWWRVEPGPFGTARPGGSGFAAGHFGAGDSVPGFTGGIEIPEILKPPPQKPFETAPSAAAGAAGGAEAAGADTDGTEELPVRRGLFRRSGGGAPGRAGTPSPLLLLAAALLVGGAVFGSLLALAAGWLIAYAGPRLSRTEAKWAVLALPGLVAGGALVWLWGRMDGRWGEPIRDGGMSTALTETWPVALRAAAVASAVFLVWRARRRPRG